MTDYIGGVATMVVIEFVAILAFSYFYYFKKYPPVYSDTAYVDCGQSIWIKKYPNANNWLLGWRIFCFLWFFCFAFVGNWIHRAAVQKKDPGYWFFTNWNLILLGIYFGFASVASWQFRSDSAGATHNSPLHKKFITCMGAMHDVAGANAIFVTVVALGILDRSLSFWNLTNHLSNTLFMFVEMFLNSVKACKHNYIWSIIWAFVYVCFTWIIVYTKTRKVPYFFLNTVDKPASFGWYTGLLIVNGSFYAGWIYLNKWLKGKVNASANANVHAHAELKQSAGGEGDEVELVDVEAAVEAEAATEQLQALTGEEDQAPAALM